MATMPTSRGLSTVASEPALRAQAQQSGQRGLGEAGKRTSGDQEREHKAQQRLEQFEHFNEAVLRGRHPRSFPLRTPLWQHIGSSSKRLHQLQAGRSLVSVLGVREDDAEELQRTHRQELAAERQKYLQSLQAPTLTRQLTIQNGIMQRSGQTMATRAIGKEAPRLVRPAAQAELVLSNPIALAQGYVAQYKSSAVRKDRFSRRMSDFRQVAKIRLDSSLRRQDSVASQGGFPGRLVDNQDDAHQQQQRHLLQSQNVSRGIREYHRKRAARASRDTDRDASNPVGTFLSLARQQGHHSKYGFVRRFLDKRDREEERNGSGQSAPTTGDRVKPGQTRPVTNATLRGGNEDGAQNPGGSDTNAAFASWRGDGPEREDDAESFRTIEFVPPAMSTPLFYGSQIAIEANDGSFLTASGPKGELAWMAHPKSIPGTEASAANGTNGVEDDEDIDDDGDGASAAGAVGNRKGRPSSSALKTAASGLATSGGSGGNSHTKPQVVFTKVKYAMLFTLVNLHDPGYVGPVNAGDDVWLCIHQGAGHFSWKDGSIIGTRVSSGAMIDTVPVDRTLGRGKTAAAAPCEKADAGGNASSGKDHAEIDEEPIGSVLPILTYIPNLPGQVMHAEKSLDELFRDASNFERVQRMNRSATHLGQWRFGVASNHRLENLRAQRRHHSSALDGGGTDLSAASSRGREKVPIENDMHVYLEQDLAFLCTADLQDGGNQMSKARELAQADASSADGSDPVKTMNPVLRKLPKKPLQGQFCVNRSGVFRVRVVQTKLDPSQAPSAGVHAKGENLLMRARVQLKRSELGRHGDRKYLPGLKSGKRFTKQLRRIRQHTEHECDEAFLAAIEDLEPEDKQQRYFFDMFQRSPLPSPTNADVDLGLDLLNEASHALQTASTSLKKDECPTKTRRGSHGGQSHGGKSCRSRHAADKDDDDEDDDEDDDDEDTDDEDEDKDVDSTQHDNVAADESDEYETCDDSDAEDRDGREKESGSECSDEDEDGRSCHDSGSKKGTHRPNAGRPYEGAKMSKPTSNSKAKSDHRHHSKNGRRASRKNLAKDRNLRPHKTDQSFPRRNRDAKGRNKSPLHARRHHRASRLRRRSSARDLLGEIEDPTLRDCILARQSKPYQQRLQEYGGVVPWFDTVHNMRLQDFKLARDLLQGRRHNKGGNALALLNSSNFGMERKRQQRELARWMNTPMYHRLLEEDQRIKTFVANESKE